MSREILEIQDNRIRVRDTEVREGWGTLEDLISRKRMLEGGIVKIQAELDLINQTITDARAGGAKTRTEIASDTTGGGGRGGVVVEGGPG